MAKMVMKETLEFIWDGDGFIRSRVDRDAVDSDIRPILSITVEGDEISDICVRRLPIPMQKPSFVVDDTPEPPDALTQWQEFTGVVDAMDEVVSDIARGLGG